MVSRVYCKIFPDVLRNRSDFTFRVKQITNEWAMKKYYMVYSFLCFRRVRTIVKIDY
jgi:hypothetical protein